MIIYYDNGPHPLLREHFIHSGVQYTTIYRNTAAQIVNRLTRGLVRPRSLIFNRPLSSEDDDKVICFDTYTDADYLRWICKHYPDKRIILWYWNPVTEFHIMRNNERKDRAPGREHLITNNRCVRQSDFYDPANIYIIGEETRSLREFLEQPQEPVEDTIKQRYLLSSWLERFDTEDQTV